MYACFIVSKHSESDYILYMASDTFVKYISVDKKSYPTEGVDGSISASSAPVNVVNL